jgi:hypothetical protein
MHKRSQVIWVGLIGTFLGFLATQLSNGPGIDPARAQQPAVGKTYEIVQVRLASGQRAMIRYNPRTGETWRMMWEIPQGEKIGTNEWRKVEEPALPAGNYEVLMMEGLIGRDNFYATRFDHATGKAWNLHGKWHEVKDEK